MSRCSFPASPVNANSTTVTTAATPNKLKAKDELLVETTTALRSALTGGWGTNFRCSSGKSFGRHRRRMSSIAVSTTPRLGRCAGGSILKPPMPGAIGGVARSAITWDLEGAVSLGFTPDDRRYSVGETSKTGLPVKCSSVCTIDLAAWRAHGRLEFGEFRLWPRRRWIDIEPPKAGRHGRDGEISDRLERRRGSQSRICTR